VRNIMNTIKSMVIGVRDTVEKEEKKNSLK
jgi:hypothetical protein